MAVKKNCKSKCIFFDFLGENLEIAPKQGKNGVEVVKVITFIRGVYEINNFRDPQLYSIDYGAFEFDLQLNEGRALLMKFIFEIRLRKHAFIRVSNSRGH